MFFHFEWNFHDLYLDCQPEFIYTMSMFKSLKSGLASMPVLMTLLFALTSTSASAQTPEGDANHPTMAVTIQSVRDRASCSSLVLARQSTDKALAAIASLGFHWVDLSCLNWAPHVSVPALMKDFPTEANRVEAILKKHELGVSNLTFDAPDSRAWAQYEPEFRAVVDVAVRLNTRIINVMAPAANADRPEMVKRLKTMVDAAKAKKITLTVETHVGQITEKPADALWLCQQVPGLGLTLDPSHYFAGPNQGANFDALLPYVRGTGFRAGGMKWEEIHNPWGTGPIDFDRLVRKMEALHYQGFYAVEYIEGFNQVDPVKESGKFLAWIQKLPQTKPSDVKP